MIKIHGNDWQVAFDNNLEYAIYGKHYWGDIDGNKMLGEEGDYLYNELIIETARKKYIISGLGMPDLEKCEHLNWADALIDRLNNDNSQDVLIIKIWELFKMCDGDFYQYTDDSRLTVKVV